MAYDCLGRRAERTAAGQITRHYYRGRQVIEEQDAANVTVATYAVGPAVDSDDPEVVFCSGPAVDNDDADVVFVSDGAGNGLLGTQAGNPYLFRGMHYDPESALYEVKDPQPYQLNTHRRASLRESSARIDPAKDDSST